MHMLLQDRTKYYRYMSFSNNLWMQLPACKRPNLRFVFMCCGLLSHVYGATDARARLILASLGEVTEAPAGIIATTTTSIQYIHATAYIPLPFA
jgi:hypothetical protein